MSREFLRRRISGTALVLLVGAWAPGEAATLFDPALHFRTLHTQHFVIYFHQGEDRLASRLAAIAEDVWPTVGQALGVTAPRRTHVVLADQSELANGWATPLPYNVIFVTAAAPAGSEFIGRTDDWLRLVFTHEFTHIVHLDRSEGYARVFRGIFGRMPLAFPNLWLPAWQVEGLATWEESTLTGEGRLHAGDFRAIEREAARAGRVEPLDRVNGGLTDWPGGLAPYASGLGFHEYLAGRFGEERFRDLVNRTSRSVPFLGSRAFRPVYGESLGDLWLDYEATLTRDAILSSRSAAAITPTRLTHHGYTVLGPRFAPTRCDGCPNEIVYSLRNPDGFPAMHAIGVDGSGSRRLATRYLGSTTGVAREIIVFDQQEIHRSVGVYSDLYVFDRRNGNTRQVTRNQRLQDPDLSPDGTSVVSVRQNAGQRDLMIARLETDGARTTRSDTASGDSRTVGEIRTLVAETETQFNAPRWSPDGRFVVVERHRLFAESEIVLVDVATGSVRVVGSDPSARIVTPTWRPDGQAIVAAADFEGDTFDLYEFGVDAEATHAPIRRLTDTTGGALWPDVSPDGTLVFVGYTSDGFDLFTMPYPRPSDVGLATAPTATGPPPVSRNISSGPVTARPYSPWPTLMPTSWEPILETGGDQLRAGFSTGAFDVLGRHAYSASATWLLNGPDEAHAPPAATPDWRLGYVYDRWQPSLFISASSNTLFSAGPPDANGRPSTATLREREIAAGVFVPIRHARTSRRVIVSFVRTMDRYETPLGGTVSRTGLATRAGVAANTAHVYGYSVSPERGVSAGSTAEFARRGYGSSDNVTTWTGDARAYLPSGAPHHVIALRAGGGASTGDADSTRTFLLGGASPNADVLDFGRDAFSLLRGFPTHTFAGTRIAVVNADYRLPLGYPQRGAGTWPAFLRTIHAAVFADAGQTWTERFRIEDAKTSVGAELSLSLVLGYSFPFTVTYGAAWGYDGATNTGDVTAYARIGGAF